MKAYKLSFELLQMKTHFVSDQNVLQFNIPM